MTSASSGFPSLFFAVRLIESAWQSSHLRPADAPCRSPVPARLSQIVDPPSTPAGPCDAISDLKRSRRPISRRLLLLPTLRRFLRLSFRFSLLRHCCPPSLSGWRHRCSAVANRSALHPDYYTGKKITVTPLNFVCKRRDPVPARTPHDASRRAAMLKTFRRCRH